MLYKDWDVILTGERIRITPMRMEDEPAYGRLLLGDPLSECSMVSQRSRELAAAAGEPMKAKYTYDELEALLSDAGFRIYEHMNADEATEAFFREYNRCNPAHSMTASKGVGYCLAVKKP